MLGEGEGGDGETQTAVKTKKYQVATVNVPPPAAVGVKSRHTGAVDKYPLFHVVLGADTRMFLPQLSCMLSLLKGTATPQVVRFHVFELVPEGSWGTGTGSSSAGKQ